MHCWAIRQNHQKQSNLKNFFETWKNFSFKVSDCLMFEWPALCNGIMLGKKFRKFFQFWLLFCCLQATVSDFGQQTSYCQIRLKKLHSPTKHHEKNLKFSKNFFSEPFFSTVGDFFKVAIAISLESRVGYQQLFTKFGRFWFCLAIFGKVFVNFSKKQVLAELGPKPCIALHCWAIRQNHKK